MRVAALDLGKVRVGLAVSDELGALAHPRPPLDGRNRKQLLRQIREFAEEEEITRFLVGLPLDASGQEGPAARKALDFAEQVAETTGLPVVMWDERFTTVEATRRLQEGGNRGKKSRQKVDGAAACVMLQAWLDRPRGRST
jgi:putative pre-16S rRNA nuclease